MRRKQKLPAFWFLMRRYKRTDGRSGHSYVCPLLMTLSMSDVSVDMIWIKKRDLDVIMSLFNRATMGGDSLVAGELFDVLLQITHSAKAQAEDGKETEKPQWHRMQAMAMGEIETILKNPMLKLESQLILGRKVLVLIDDKVLEEADKRPIL